MVLHLSSIRRDLGGRTLFRDVSCRVGEGDRIGLVGANGSGKTTLLRILDGLDPPDEGKVERRKDLRIGYLPQEVAILGDRSILDVVLEGGAEAREVALQIQSLEERLAADDPELGDDEAAHLGALHEQLDALGGYDLEARARRILSGLGFEDDQHESPVSSFSGGWMMRVALARILIAEPDLLLLDEPTNHLDLPSLVWLEEYLAGFSGAILLVSHDQTFLDRLVTSVFELSQGKLTRYTGNYSKYVEQRQVRIEQQSRAYAQQQREIADQERWIDRFRAKNTKASQVQSRVKMLEKLERIEAPVSERKVQKFQFPAPNRTGQRVCRLDDLAAGYGDHVVLSKVALEVERGDRVALVGRNGEGKTTLSKVIAGELAPLSGERVMGSKVDCTYFGQHLVTQLDLHQSVLDSALEKNKEHNVGLVRSALGAFLFDSDDLVKQVGVLSGGEKARLALARMLLEPAPFLVLDEPTNHLDIASRTALEAALQQFPGTLVMVSHDRRFLNRLATVVIEVAHGTIDRYEGNYDDYVYQRERRLAGRKADAARGSTESTPAPPKPPRQPRERKEATAAGKSAEPRLSQKERRRLAQERRDALKPLTGAVRRLEREVAALEARLQEIDTKLADPEFYDGPFGGEAFRERATLARDLEIEMDHWMQAQGKLETAQKELDQD